MNPSAVRKAIAPLIPYLTIGIGLLVLHNAWVAMLGYHAGIIAILAWSKYRPNLKQLYKNRKLWLSLIGGLGGLGSGVLLYLLWPVLSIPDNISTYINSVGLNDRTWSVFIIYFVIVNPVLEEYFWRGFLNSTTEKPVLNDLLFAGYHPMVFAGHIANIWLLVIFLGLVAGAWAWRQLNRFNQGILASTISHLSADIIIILTIYYFCR
jgi:membrane protease YdiL (CAAX protease family)